MRRHDPETIALRALAFIAASDEGMAAFLGACGADAETVRIRASEPEFLGFVLDYLLQDEAGVVAFSRSEGLAPEAVMQARIALPGGDAPEWT